MKIVTLISNNFIHSRTTTTVQAPGELWRPLFRTKPPLEISSPSQPTSSHDLQYSLVMAYHPQPCDTFFVESSDGYTQRSSQDYIKMIGRRKQEAMANELSRQACDTYGEDIHAHMVQMEVKENPGLGNWRVPSVLTFLPERDATRRCLDQHPTRDSMVYETLPDRLPHRSPLCLPTAARDTLPRCQPPRSILLTACGLQETLPAGWMCCSPHRSKVRGQEGARAID